MHLKKWIGNTKEKGQKDEKRKFGMGMWVHKLKLQHL